MTFGQGPLSRALALVYTLLVVELLVLLTTVPGLAAVMLLDRDASNLPLMALCAVPVGPALSAAVFALRHTARDLGDLNPAREFWRGYRLNAAPALRLWVCWLVWITVLAFNLSQLPSGWWTPLTVVLAAAGTIGMVNALVITSLFAFRAVDVARLAGYYLIRTPGVPAGTAALLVLAAAVTWLSSEAVLALCASVLAAALLRTAAPMIADIRERFVA